MNCAVRLRINMASPQLENGHTRIANEILDAIISTDWCGVNELKMLLLVIRKTYGYGKKTDCISLSQFAKICNISRRSAAYCINRLVQRNALVHQTALGKNSMSLYSLNKDWESWVVHCVALVQSSVSKVVQPVAPTKESITKEKKDSSKQVKPHVLSSDYTLTDKLIAYARSHGLQNGQIETEFEKFKNYFLATGRKYVDWDRAFYNWVLRAKDSKPKGKQDDFYKNWKVQ